MCLIPTFVNVQIKCPNKMFRVVLRIVAPPLMPMLMFAGLSERED
jgi:hypothetical protein